MRARVTALALALGLLAAACGGSGSGGQGDGKGGLGVSRVELMMDNDDFMNQVAWIIADEKYWPGLGFSEPAEVSAGDEYLAALIGGSVWVAQGETDAIFAAMAEGAPIVAVGVEKGKEVWEIGAREGIDTAQDLVGRKISGGPPGDRNISIGRRALQELGVNPDDLEWVSIEGGSDERLQALLAGQIDAAVLQPRHRSALEGAGGKILFYEVKEAPQELWVVTRSFLERNRQAVCAYLEGRIQAKRWAAEGGPPHYDANKDEAVAMARERRIDPTRGDLEEWGTEMETNWSLDGGASAASFDAFVEDLKAAGTVPDGFNWREHVDFSCLREVQQKLGLEPNPAEAS